MLEIECKPVFYYGQHMPQAPLKDPPPKENVAVSGAEFTIKYDNKRQQNVVVLTSRATKDDGKGTLEMGLISFIADLQNTVQEYLDVGKICRGREPHPTTLVLSLYFSGPYRLENELCVRDTQTCKYTKIVHLFRQKNA
jgi:hypothetical protein